MGLFASREEEPQKQSQQPQLQQTQQRQVPKPTTLMGSTTAGAGGTNTDILNRENNKSIYHNAAMQEHEINYLKPDRYSLASPRPAEQYLTREQQQQKKQDQAYDENKYRQEYDKKEKEQQQMHQQQQQKEQQQEQEKEPQKQQIDLKTIKKLNIDRVLLESLAIEKLKMSRASAQRKTAMYLKRVLFEQGVLADFLSHNISTTPISPINPSSNPSMTQNAYPDLKKNQVIDEKTPKKILKTDPELKAASLPQTKIEDRYVKEDINVEDINVEDRNVEDRNVEHINVEDRNVEDRNVKDRNVKDRNVEHINVEHINVEHINVKEKGDNKQSDDGINNHSSIDFKQRRRMFRLNNEDVHQLNQLNKLNTEYSLEKQQQQQQQQDPSRFEKNKELITDRKKIASATHENKKKAVDKKMSIKKEPIVSFPGCDEFPNARPPCCGGDNNNNNNHNNNTASSWGDNNEKCYNEQIQQYRNTIINQDEKQDNEPLWWHKSTKTLIEDYNKSAPQQQQQIKNKRKLENDNDTDVQHEEQTEPVYKKHKKGSSIKKEITKQINNNMKSKENKNRKFMSRCRQNWVDVIQNLENVIETENSRDQMENTLPSFWSETEQQEWTEMRERVKQMYNDIINRSKINLTRLQKEIQERKSLVERFRDSNQVDDIFIEQQEARLDDLIQSEKELGKLLGHVVLPLSDENPMFLN